ncbi:MAG: hypothetical protein IJK33_01155 [Clostridia bacterium]|nr:hypothetical protein [Clostridia bacterium]
MKTYEETTRSILERAETEKAQLRKKNRVIRTVAAFASVAIIAAASVFGIRAFMKSAPHYTTDYKAEYKDSFKVSWAEAPGTIDECIERAQIVAEIKILGLATVYTPVLDTSDRGELKFLPESIYVGEIVKEFKNETKQDEYVYILRFGSPEASATGSHVLMPGERMVMFLKQTDYDRPVDEYPIYYNSFSCPFQELYIYEYDGKEYAVPYTMQNFMPRNMATVSADIASEINSISGLYRWYDDVYEYDAVKSYITDAVNK